MSQTDRTRTALAGLSVLVGIALAVYGTASDLPAVTVYGSVFVSAGLIAALLLNVDLILGAPDERDGDASDGGSTEDGDHAAETGGSDDETPT